jgi:nucleotide-binding universal stress UspA family protein
VPRTLEIIEMSEPVRIRVLVAFDCSHPSSEALQRLPQLLGSESLELTALYVEDEDLMRAARLPGLREISLSGQEVELSVDRIEQDMARDLVRLRNAFEHTARELQLHYRFEVARGRVSETLCAAASESDFVLVTRTLRRSGLRARTAPQFESLASQARRILFVNEPWASGSSIVVLGADPIVIEAGARLAEAEALRLIITLPRLAGMPEHLPSQATIVRTQDWSEDAIANLCLQQDARLLIVPGDATLDTGALLTRLLDRLPCSLLKLG